MEEFWLFMMTWLPIHAEVIGKQSDHGVTGNVCINAANPDQPQLSCHNAFCQGNAEPIGCVMKFVLDFLGNTAGITPDV